MLFKKPYPFYVEPQKLLTLLPKGSRFLLESTQVTEEHRFALLGCGPLARYSASILGGDGEPFGKFLNLIDQRDDADPSLPFSGGLVGGLTYEAARFFENVPVHVDSIGLPQVFFYYVDHFLLYDLVQKTLQIVALGDTEGECREKIGWWEGYLQECRHHQQNDNICTISSFDTPFEQTSNFTRAQYIEAILRIQEYIRAGHSYQVNLAQRFSLSNHADPISIYRTLSQLSPVSFASYFEWDNKVIISASPERLFKIERGNIHTRPIAGTRRMGGQEEVKTFLKELATDPKERAEHAMLVDLARNDLGRICTFGSVKIEKFMELVHYRYVIHTESVVTGKLRSDTGVQDVFRALFPGGTITGVPKIRTMEIINELEPHNRSIYTGSLGYMSRCGNMDFNIMIRSIICKEDQAVTWAGGGITVDAIPEREYKETFHKVKPQILAILSANKM